MTGLHVCKPGNAPTVGQVKTFVISGDRIKSKKVEEGGQTYKIVAVTQNETYKDSYGNVGYDIQIEPALGAQAPPQSTPAFTQRAATGNGNDDRSNRIERQHSQAMMLQYFAMIGGFPEGKKPHEVMREMTSWFQRDIGHSPEKEATNEESF